MTVLAWGLIGYVFGSVPSAWLLAAASGRRDALDGARRDRGSGDAHVRLREAGAGRIAAWAATADVLKALVPTLVAVLVVGPYEAAACAVGTVAGHCWPPMFRAYAGRGLAAAAGAFLAILPVEMVLAGAITGVGTLAKRSGASSTVGFLTIPLFAAWRDEPEPYRFVAWVIVALIVSRRLEGIGAVVADGTPAARAVIDRAVFDR